MRFLRILPAVGLAFIFVFASLVYADVPQMINYQGKITTPAGALVDTTVGMIFTIYDDSTAGSALWTETQDSVIVQKGIFSVILGSINPIPDGIFVGSVMYLGVKVGTDPEMTPRKEIVSVAYAYRAATVDGGGVSCGWIDDGTVVRLEQSTDSVGIGTANPSSELHVQGDLTCSGSLIGGTHNHWGETWTGTGTALNINSTGASRNGDSGAVNVNADTVAVGGVSSSSIGVVGVGHSEGGGGVHGGSDHGKGVSGRSKDGTGVFGYCSTGVAIHAWSDSGTALLVDGSSIFNCNARFNCNATVAGTLKVGKLSAEEIDPIILELFKVDPSQVYQKGDVLVIDPESDSYKLCYTANDTKVAGVVWNGNLNENGELPVVILGAKAPTKTVYVKSDASYAPIKRGDLLTSSPTPGHAMRANEPKLGSIIGKALEPLDSGKGLIKAFVTLH
jgi:hypothetical protein